MLSSSPSGSSITPYIPDLSSNNVTLSNALGGLNQTINQKTEVTFFERTHRVTLEEAEHLCGYQLLTHAGNLTKILQSMRDIRKQQRQLHALFEEVGQKQAKRPQTAAVFISKKRTSPQRFGYNQSHQVVQQSTETEKLLQQKRDLLAKLDQKKAKNLRLQHQRDEFRAFLFSNHRGCGKRSKSNNQDDGSHQFNDIPSNLNNLYFDAVQDKNFAQIKIDLFSTTLRRQVDGFLRTRADQLQKVAAKRTSVKKQGDQNQALKRKYIKKQVDYKRVLRGEEIDEPQNFLQQMINDIKRGMEERKAVAEAMEQAQAEAIMEQQPSSQEHAQLQQQLKQQAATRLDQLEVKTISERSQEESNCSTPAVGGGGGHYHSLSLATNPEVANKVTEYTPGVGQPPKKQIQILELLNEICEDSRDTTLVPEEEEKEKEKDLPSTSETEQEEDQVMQQIMNVLQGKVQTGGSSDPYQSLTFTDGIYLQNINGEQLQQVIAYLYNVDRPDDHMPLQIPTELMKQMELFETAEYLGLDELKVQIVTDGVMKRPEFIKYTNVRRHYLENINEEALPYIFESLPPSVLLFTLTDPALETISSQSLEYECRYLFEEQYGEFTRNRLELIEKMKDDDQYRFVFDEDLMYLTKEYHEVYNDTQKELKMTETISKHICEQIKQLRDEFKSLPFDFHSCFYFDPADNSFKLHRKFHQQEDNQAFNPLVNAFRRPLVLFSAINCEVFAESCLMQVFQLSQRFSKVRVLNLRGMHTLSKEALLDGVIKTCTQLAHLNLNFVKSVDDEILSEIGTRFRKTLLSLELRSCQLISDAGIIELCEGLSSIKEKRGTEIPMDEATRYRFYNRHDTESILKYLNIGDQKQLSNKAMKAVAFNLFPALVELSIWGCYRITSEGFLELCTAQRSDNFRRVNYCGCYKISDDSRLWISSTFSRVIIYNKVEEFGKDINYSEYVEEVNKQTKASEQMK